MFEYRKPSILEANIIYLILGFALLFGGYMVQQREVYSGLLITEFIIILLPNLLYLKLKGYSLKNVLRINPISFVQVVFVILIMIFSYPIAVFLNALFLLIINSFSSALPTTVPIPTDIGGYLSGMFVIAIAPGICEEVMFRGTIKSAYDKLGYRKSVIISAILFGVFHFNIMNLIGPIFLGVILGILINKTNSIFSSILGHTLNNAFALSIGYVMTKYMPAIEELSDTNIINNDKEQIIMSIIVLGSLAILCIFALIFLFKHIPANKRYEEVFGFSEISFNHERYRAIKYLPVLIIFVVFVILNIRLLFNV